MQSISMSLINIIGSIIIMIGAFIIAIINIKRLTKYKKIVNNRGELVGIRRPSVIRIMLMLFFLVLVISFSLIVLLTYSLNLI